MSAGLPPIPADTAVRGLIERIGEAIERERLSTFDYAHLHGQAVALKVYLPPSPEVLADLETALDALRFRDAEMTRMAFASGQVRGSY